MRSGSRYPLPLSGTHRLHLFVEFANRVRVDRLPSNEHHVAQSEQRKEIPRHVERDELAKIARQERSTNQKAYRGQLEAVDVKLPSRLEQVAPARELWIGILAGPALIGGQPFLVAQPELSNETRLFSTAAVFEPAAPGRGRSRDTCPRCRRSVRSIHPSRGGLGPVERQDELSTRRSKARGSGRARC